MTLLKVLNYKVLPKKKPSDYFGILSKEKGEEMLKYVNESRDEWEERNIKLRVIYKKLKSNLLNKITKQKPEFKTRALKK
ncbi:MAG: hypothetical protein ACOYMA_14975 [Bacteroidia bacterium]